MPVPPAATGFPLRSDVSRHRRPVSPDHREYFIKNFLKTFVARLSPPLQQHCPLTFEAISPVWVVFDRNNRSVVCPVFKKRAFAFEQTGQLRRPIGLVPREQDHVVGTGDRIDTIDLNETE